MKIIRTEIYKFTIPMEPFVIATETSYYAQNIFIRIHTDSGLSGVGECSAFPMLVGETQNTCFEVAKDFGNILKGKDPIAIAERMNELHDYIAFNSTIKSAFEMGLFDLAAKEANQPLYKFLGGEKKVLETDLTIGIETPIKMARSAKDYIQRGVRMIKIKLGKNVQDDVLRVRLIREAVGNDYILRIDANQGWDFDEASFALLEMGEYDIQFCEQPMRRWDDEKLPELRRISPIKIMMDESVFNHHDAARLIKSGACDYVNIKFAKSGGILEAQKINAVCEANNIHCMMGGMLESRVALTAFGHFALSAPNIKFYDMDTCLLGHKIDPVVDGIKFKGFFLEVPDSPGIGADADEAFLKKCESIRV